MISQLQRPAGMAPKHEGAKLGGAELLAPLQLQHTALQIIIKPVDVATIDKGHSGAGRPTQTGKDEAAKLALCDFVDKLDDGA